MISLAKWIGRHYFSALTVLVFGALLLATGILARITNIPWLNLSFAEPVDQSVFLSTMVQALATILAIQFSISILAVQHAASNYTPSILSRYAHDARVWFAFAFESGGLVFAATSVVGPKLSHYAEISIAFLVGTLFYLGLHFILTISLVNPRNVLRDLERRTLSKVSRIPKNILSEIRKEHPVDEFEKKIRRSSLYREFLFHRPETLRDMRNEVIIITDIIQRSAARREYETSLEGFRVLASIAEGYVATRKTDPSPGDEFIEFLLERLFAVSSIAFQAHDAMILQEAVKGMEKVGVASLQIVPSAIDQANLSAHISVDYLAKVGRLAVQRGFFDLSVESIRGMTRLGCLALAGAKDDMSVQQKILTIGRDAAKVGSWFVLGSCVNFALELASCAVRNRQSATYFEDIVGSIQELSIIAIENHLAGPVLPRVIGPMPNTGIIGVAADALSIKNEKFEKIETRQREEFVKQVINSLIQAVEAVGRAALDSDDRLSVKYAVRTSHSIGVLVTGERLTTFKDNFSDEIDSIITTIGSLQYYDSKLHPCTEPDLSLSLADLAMHLIDNKYEDLTVASAKVIGELAQNCVTEEDTFTGPRVAAGIVMIAMYADHSSRPKIAEACAKLLAEFDKRYLELCKKPTEGLHIEQTRTLVNEFGSNRYLKKLKESGAISSLESFISVYKIQRDNIGMPIAEESAPS